MLAAPAAALGIGLRVLTASPADPAAQVVADVEFGDWHDPGTVRRFARGCAVVTVADEHLPADVVVELERSGTVVRTGAPVLRVGQDRLHQRTVLTGLGHPCPNWGAVRTPADVAACAERWGWPILLTAPGGRADGCPTVEAACLSEAEAVLGAVPAAEPWLAEQQVRFTRALAAVVVRSPSGQAAGYPVVETMHKPPHGVEVLAPAPALAEEHALAAAERALAIAADLDVTGVLAVELLDTGRDLLVSGLSTGPHSSGHWTIEGAVTSQFENHLRAVLDYPLGDPRMLCPAAVMVAVRGGEARSLTGAYRHVFARDPRVKVHRYGNEVRPGLTLGHVTVLGESHEPLRARAHHAADYLSGRIDE